MTLSEANHSVFDQYFCSKLIIYLVVYADDKVITDSVQNGISKLKQTPFQHLYTKDLVILPYFLGIEVAQFIQGIVLSQLENTKWLLIILGKPG